MQGRRELVTDLRTGQRCVAVPSMPLLSSAAAPWRDFLVEEARSARMSRDSNTAGVVDSLNRLNGRNLHALNVAPAPVENELRRKRRLHVGYNARLHHRLGHVRPGDVLGATGNLQHTVE